ncbi:MarR family winged helix-turn-helix transcriptional regulator [Kordiimonas lacus]|uniref:DNA-binding transcriptional regulator, MarR family n=1 Tax=Kordiimonas lacus TaxID=637679 RepID=A0A1G7F4I4_9PROT|nr:MarR family winged helix-turn-helix transcriptional regulator [Kordiimonas lacus]SDE70844.1 DNA-binding transcriptional regulator, MarR family [Kordiimonas lacus]
MKKSKIIEKLKQDVAGQCACQKLRKATRIITRRYDEALKPIGIKGNQFTMLSVISLVDAVTLTELADKMGMERTTLIRNLKPLERDGLISISSEGFRRARSAEITDKGLNVLEEALPIWHQAQDSLRIELGANTWKIVHDGLEALGAVG